MSQLGHRGGELRRGSDRHIADRILMKLPPFSDEWNEEVIFGVVEGSNDVEFYASFFRRKNEKGLEHCVLEEAEGKEEVKSAVRELKRQFKIRGIKNLCFGLIDADFKGKAPSGDFFITDGHDIECLSIKSEAFESFVKDSTDPEKLRDFLVDNDWREEGALGLRGYLCLCAADLGRLKWVSLNKKYYLRFKMLRPLDDFIDGNTLKLLTKKVVKFFKSFEPGKLAHRDILSDMEKKDWGRMSRWLVIQGHDMCFLIAMGLSRFGAPNSMVKSKHDGVVQLGMTIRDGRSNLESVALQVERAIRGTFSIEYFRATQLYGAIVSWQEQKIESGQLQEPILN